ncbi:hypothetical protein [Xanthobacter sp. KR7-225]|uniref:hypothetical protein n=1 Tax=Xanthobacter sp. KR7-225 TaxID=3156613 RepID=UPI0032B554E3
MQSNRHIQDVSFYHTAGGTPMGQELAFEQIRDLARQLARSGRFCSWRLIAIELRFMEGIRAAGDCFTDAAIRNELDTLCRDAQKRVRQWPVPQIDPTVRPPAAPAPALTRPPLFPPPAAVPVFTPKPLRPQSPSFASPPAPWSARYAVKDPS